MNVPNNKRRQNTLLKIHTAFIDLLETRELDDISVTDICGKAGINRTTFYRQLQASATLSFDVDGYQVRTGYCEGGGLQR